MRKTNPVPIKKIGCIMMIIAKNKIKIKNTRNARHGDGGTKHDSSQTKFGRMASRQMGGQGWGESRRLDG